MARILLIETATEVCSAAIAVDGMVVAIAEELHSQNHAALLTLQIEQCAAVSGIPLAELDAVAVSQGPGSYTSLRVGASVAKGICYALDKPLISIDTLLALAWASREAAVANPQPATSNPKPETSNPKPETSNQQPETYYVPMLDARRQEVWTAVYDEALRPLTPAQPLIMENNLFEKFIQYAAPSSGVCVFVVAGNGSFKIENVKNLENAVLGQIKNCSARHLVVLAEQFFQNAVFQDVAYFEPFYMKPPNITTPTKAQF